MKFKHIVSLVSLIVFDQASNASSIPIEEIFPKAFEGSGINLREASFGAFGSLDVFGSIQGYAVEEFSSGEENRNHWDSRGETPIQFLVMHYTVCDFPDTLKLFTANVDSNRVSAHYVLTQSDGKYSIKGGIPVQVVPEEKRAWHAGVSAWRGIKNLNAFSIGIENINSGFFGAETAPTWFVFDPYQTKTLGLLSSDIIRRYKIPPQNVVGHADIAPTRKQDPGILFPWEELYETWGIGAGLSREERKETFISTQYFPKEPLPQGVSEAFFLTCLRRYGYEFPESAVITPEIQGVVKAFKAHFSHNQRPEGYTPVLDEKAMYWAWALDAKYSTRT